MDIFGPRIMIDNWKTSLQFKVILRKESPIP